MVGKKKSIFRSPPVISWALYTIYATCLSGFLLYIKASFHCGIPRGTKGPEALLFKPILSSFYHKASLTVLAFLLLDEVKLLSRVQLFATPWTIAYQAPPSMGFSRQECWSGLPFPFPGDLPDPEIEPGLPHCRQTLYRLSHQGSTTWEAPKLLTIGTMYKRSLGFSHLASLKFYTH